MESRERIGTLTAIASGASKMANIDKTRYMLAVHRAPVESGNQIAGRSHHQCFGPMATSALNGPGAAIG